MSTLLSEYQIHCNTGVMSRGQLRVYLGAAPGVGKTFAMLSEGTRRQQRGSDVVVGQVDDHRQSVTLSLVEQLERCDVKLGSTDHRRASNRLDVQAVLRRRPEVVLIDDLATWWADVDALLDAEIDVVATLGVEHIASLADVVTTALGEPPTKSVPDTFLRRADQIELVDMTPEALLRRIAHGNVFDPDEQADVVSQWSSPETLNALRRHALIWLADGLRQEQGDQTRESVVVAVTGAEGNDTVILRAARLALRTRSDLIGVHINDAHRGLTDRDGLPRRSSSLLVRHRELVNQLGGTFHELADDDIASALVTFARSHGPSRLVLGASRRSRLSELTTGSIVSEVIRRAGDLEVHVMSAVGRSTAPQAALLRRLSGGRVFGRNRMLLGCLFGLVALLAVTGVGLGVRAELSVVLSLLLLSVVASARIGGRVGSLFLAVVSPFVANYFFVEPTGSFRIAQKSSLVELVVFLAVAVLTSSVVTSAARQAREASMLAGDAETLAAIVSHRTGNGNDDLAILTDEMRRNMGQLRLEVRQVTGKSAVSPEPSLVLDLGDGTELLGWGPPIDARSRRLLPIYAIQLRSAAAIAKAEEQKLLTADLREADALKMSLLQTVSHDLRTPLGGIKAAVSSLRQPDIEWSANDEADFLQTIEENTDRLTAMVTNVLDFSRLQSGTLKPTLRCAALEEVVPAAVASIGPRGNRVVVQIPAGLVDVLTDPPMLERVVANTVANAVIWSPIGTPVVVHASAVGNKVCLQVIDHGPGIPPAQRARVMEPFERASRSSPNSSGGVGLGLAIAGGLTHAVGGTIRLRDTPGGGLTVELMLPVAPA